MAEKLKQEIEAACAGVTVTLESVAEPKGEFKVTVNGEVIHDKAKDNSGFCLLETVQAKL